MIKIGIVDKFHEDGIKLLEDNPKFEYEIIEDLSKKNLISKLSIFDGITLRRGNIDSEILEKCKKLKVISRHGVGYDNIDTKFLKKNNIKLLVTATTTSVSPAEHIMFMILSISKGHDFYDQAVRDGKFESIMHMKNNNNFEISNKKILIVEMQVYVYDPFVDKKTIDKYGGVKIENLDEGLKTIDILSLSVPLTKETHNMINIKKMKLMKKKSIIINTSRGGVVNEIDLSKHIAKAKIFVGSAGTSIFETSFYKIPTIYY